jgi:hypothetical protein
MRIQITINLHRHQVSRLAAACEKYALSRRELIALLVSRCVKKQRLACSIFKCVR